MASTCIHRHREQIIQDISIDLLVTLGSKA